MATKKTLFDFYTELSELGFDKKKVQGLVKRANTAGYDIYYAYHEDEADTWKQGWRSSDYKENESDVKIFECTELIGKKKPSHSFQRAATYTAECAIFVFCPIKTLMKDGELAERKIETVKAQAKKSAIANYESFMQRVEHNEKISLKIQEWENMPLETRQKIEKLVGEYSQANGFVGAKIVRKELDTKIKGLGGRKPELLVITDWMKEVLSFENIDSYIEYCQINRVESFMKSLEIAE